MTTQKCPDQIKSNIYFYKIFNNIIACNNNDMQQCTQQGIGLYKVYICFINQFASKSANMCDYSILSQPTQFMSVAT